MKHIVIALALCLGACGTSTRYVTTLEFRSGGDSGPFLTTGAVKAEDYSAIETGEVAVVGLGPQPVIGRPNTAIVGVLSPVSPSSSEGRTLDIDGDGIADFADAKTRGPRFESLKLTRIDNGKWVSSSTITNTTNGDGSSEILFRIYAINVGNATFTGPIRFVERISPLIKFRNVVGAKQVADLRAAKTALAFIPFVQFVNLAMENFPEEKSIQVVPTFKDGLLTVDVPDYSLPSGKGVFIEYLVEIPLTENTAAEHSKQNQGGVD